MTKNFGATRTGIIVLGVFAMIGVLVFLGCPWRTLLRLAGKMVGQKLDAAPDPLEIGHTLCGYALGLADKEMKHQCLP